MPKQDILQELHLDHEAREGGGQPWLWRLLLVLVIGGLAVGGYVMRLSQTPTVETVPAEAPGVGAATVLDATGYVIARRQATVSSKISGKLAEVLIEEGVQVATGQILARLDDTDARAQLGLAQARLSAARSQLDQLRIALEQARRDLKRQEGLGARQLTSEELLENARTQVETRAALLEAQRSQVRVAEAEVAVAQVAVDNTIVRAPFTGVVVAKAAQLGEIVSPMSAGGGFTRTGIGTIVDMDSLEIEVDVNESFINRVKPDQPVQAVLDAYPDWKIPATVIAIIPTADRAKATVKVRIAITAKDPRLLPEMGVRVSFLEELGQAREGVLVPAGAIVARADHSLVFVLDGDRVRERRVTLGELFGERRQVLQGLAVGERVVSEPPPGLVDGGRVIRRDGT
ncbi:efflux RND transporter periplasmic adaptor subunit [Lamprocystis purpurea]|jgi:RND family efflux transporter MFP subunit|uniref:efflux RND transporter periplasmic adaptor subunit n=1 Tax=Lamprocystis purpurea TaxID=61598 RepID=UPI0003812EE0|nr:efflux RND transporter periplasmic adaptor subunit [Lamprocystis purpurea]